MTAKQHPVWRVHGVCVLKRKQTGCDAVVDGVCT